MRRVSLYSSSDPSRRRSRREADEHGATAAAAQPAPAGAAAVPPPALPETPPKPAAAAPSVAAADQAGARWRPWRRHPHAAVFAASVLTVLLALPAYHHLVPPPRPVADEHIEKLIERTIERKALAAPTARAFRTIAPSVVRVRGYAEPGKEKGKGKEKEDEALSIGTGVVIVDRGVILTSLHVVAGSPRLKVTFADGLESDAELVGARPEQDLAVLQAATLPDDLVAATMRSSGDLALGQPVAAVGFPFDVGLTVTEGVVSGLGREFRTPAGRMPLRDLIQFDAAVNPGSSGGPLVTMDGEVVGIVTGILNPTDEGFFVGIGFAVPIESAAGAAGLSPF